MESPNQLVIARGDAAIAAPRTTSLIGRGITALNVQRQAALLAEAQHSRYQAARAVIDRQSSDPWKTMFTDEEAKTLYSAYCTLRELAEARYMQACYPVARFLRGGWRILPHEDATRDMLAADRVERIRLYVMTHALCNYQDNNLAALIADDPVDLVSVIEWCAEHFPPSLPATKATPEYLPLRDLDKSLEYEKVALAWLESLESPNENEALYDFGVINMDGHAANDFPRAFQCFVTAANDGFAKAQQRLGWMYEYGKGVHRDATEAVRWYLLGAEQGNAVAQLRLGVMYGSGSGVERDDADAARLIRLSALQGHTVAQSMLGHCHSHGLGVERDCSEAVRWYLLSAEQGNAVAQQELGLMYANGRGVERDDDQAVHWLRLSAQQMNVSAQCSRATQRCLGWSYELGRGVKQDATVAARWYQLSAQQGDVQGQYCLGLVYEFGRGVTQDLSQAQYWYQKSADQNYADAIGRLTFLLKKKLAHSGGA